MQIFASFVLIIKDGLVCATTREDGRIGLPGGKCEPGESAYNTAIREANEEGWQIDPNETGIPLLVQLVEGRPVSWFLFKSSVKVTKLTDHQESARGITPILVPINEFRTSGFGNDIALDLAMPLLEWWSTNK